MNYIPQPGTIVAKVIAYLEKLPEGEEIATGPLCDAIGLSVRDGLNTTMGPALKAGIVLRRNIPEKGLMNWWKLGDWKPQVAAKTTPARAPVPRPDPAPIEVPRFQDQTAAEPEPEPEPELAPEPEVDEFEVEAAAFDAWLSGATGALVLQGVAVDEDGEVVLTADQVAVVRSALGGGAA